MANIGDYLKRFSLLLNDKKEEKGIIVSILRKNNIPIETDQCEIKDTYVYIKTSPILRNEILIQKKNLLQEIRENGVRITDFR